MFVTHDLRCTQHPDEHYELSVLYRRSDGPTACPMCGAERTVFYATRAMHGYEEADHGSPQVGTFRPLTFGGTTYHDAQSFNRAIDTYCYNNKIDRSQVAIESKNQSSHARNARVEEAKHAGVVTRRRAGYDERQYREYVREQRREH